MATLTVGFSKPKKFKPFAWLIMKGYGIPYSHVYIKFWSDKFQRHLIYQASGTIVNFMGELLFTEANEVVKEFDIEVLDDNKTGMIQFAIDSAGKHYGMKNALGLAIVRLFDIFGKKIKNPLADGDKTYVCCELVSQILKEYTHLDPDLDHDNVTPKELYEFMSSLK